MAVPSAEGCNVGCPIVLPLVCRILSAFACLWDALELYGLTPNLNLKVDNLSDSFHIVWLVSLAGDGIRLNCASVDIDHEETILDLGASCTVSNGVECNNYTYASGLQMEDDTRISSTPHNSHYQLEKIRRLHCPRLIHQTRHWMVPLTFRK
eukprot:scaffold6034_cov133-Chaetoceros_neogracile.AAC.2